MSGANERALKDSLDNQEKKISAVSEDLSKRWSLCGDRIQDLKTKVEVLTGKARELNSRMGCNEGYLDSLTMRLGYSDRYVKFDRSHFRQVCDIHKR